MPLLLVIKFPPIVGYYRHFGVNIPFPPLPPFPPFPPFPPRMPNRRQHGKMDTEIPILAGDGMNYKFTTAER